MPKKKAKHTPLFIYNHTYRTNIYVSYGVDVNDWVESVKRYVGIEIQSPENKEGMMQVLENGEGIQIIWIWTKYKIPSILAHEALHAVIYDLNSKGILLSDDSDEAFCYYLQLIIRQTLEEECHTKIIKKKKP